MQKSKALSILIAGFVTTAIMCGQDTSAEQRNTRTIIAGVSWGDTSSYTALKPAETVRVSNIVDGDTVVLDDNRQVRLVGIQAPKLPLGRKGFPTWPFAHESAELLTTLALHQEFALHFGQTPRDRHGRLLAHMVRHDGVWLQGSLLKAGMARVYTFPDNTKLASEMLTIERRARGTRSGIWTLSHYALRRAEKQTWPRGTGFEIVQGVVKNVNNVRGTYYLNFGADWKTDFTVTIPPRWRHTFDKAGIDPMHYANKNILVRGWVRKRNGWMITATHPQQLETTGR